MKKILNLPNFILFVGISLEAIRTLTMAIYSPYYLAKGLNFSEVSSVKIFQILGILICEIPAGYLSDKFGRLKLFRISLLFFCLGFFLLFVAESYLVFSIAEFIYGMAFALNSGTLFGYFNKELCVKNIKNFNTGEFFSKYFFVQNIFVLISGNLGERFYEIKGEYLFLLSSVLFFILYLANFVILKYFKITDNFSSDHLRFSVKNLNRIFNDKKVVSYILYSMVFTGSSQIIYQYWPLKFGGVNLKIIFTSMMVSSVLGSYISKKLYFYFNDNLLVQKIGICFLSIPLICFCYFEKNYVLIIMFVISQFGRGIIFSDLSKVGNDAVSNYEFKSTIFSVKGTLTQISSLLFLGLNSILVNYISINYLWAATGAIVFLFYYGYFKNIISSENTRGEFI